MTRERLRLVIFDCDGVLIDSEALSRRVIAEAAARLGARFTEEEARAYTGLRWSDLQPVFERAVGRRLSATWPADMQQELIAAMAEGIQTVEGAADMIDATRALGLKLRVASNSSHEEMAEKFVRTGLMPRVQDLLHSARDVARGKPAPDVFLAAAAAEGVPPEACLVVEDSRPGIMAAAAAGMACIAYAPEGLPADLAAFAKPISRLSDLAPILRHAMLGRAA